jgi:hypothetical protein
MRGEITMRRIVLFALSVTALMAGTMSTLAHHGRGDTYTNAKTATSKATVTEFDFTNPHVRIYFDAKDESGAVTNWACEMANVSQFVRAGWTKRRMDAELKPGVEITVNYRISNVQQPPGKGACIANRILNAKGEVVGLERGGGGE